MDERWEDPLETRDASGEIISLDQPAMQVVSLVPSITETIFAIDGGASLIGRTRYCIHPKDEVGTVPTLGGTKDVDVAKVIELAPDLVFANREENIAEQVAELRAAGLKVHVSEPRTPDEALSLVAFVGSAIGEIETAAGMVMRGEQVLHELQEARDAAKEASFLRLNPKRAPRVLALIWRDPWMAAGGDTYISGVIEALGGVNLFAARDRYPEISLEEIASLAPDVILLPSEPWHFKDADREEIAQACPRIPAVKEGRIHLCIGEDLMWFGSRTAGALRRLRALFG